MYANPWRAKGHGNAGGKFQFMLKNFSFPNQEKPKVIAITIAALNPQVVVQIIGFFISNMPSAESTSQVMHGRCSLFDGTRVTRP